MNSIFKQLISFILPVTALVIVPLLIESDFSFSAGFPAFPGLFIMAAGFSLVVITISMFIHIGRGTLAPWSPTQKLVTTGVYGYVRNPMITAVFTVLIGEALIFNSLSILIWALVFFVINYLYFILSEEPGLIKRFGDEYLEYKHNVPRWIPRLTAWVPDKHNQTSLH